MVLRSSPARLAAALLLFSALVGGRLGAQSPNTAGLVVLVVDQTGGVVSDAAVMITNAATGATREAPSGPDGVVTAPALSLTGSYTVHVTKIGFTAEDVNDLALRAGETATVKVTLRASGGQTAVVVYGTNQGVRADAQIGRRLESETIDEIPILGRKVTTVPLFNSAFRQGKGTGDLFVNATYFITASGSRRTTTYMLDGASNDEAWGRQTMQATVPVGAVQEVSVLANAFSSEYGWTSGPAMNIVTKTGTNAMSGEVLYLGRPAGSQATSFSTDGFCPASVPSCTTPGTLNAINPSRYARRAQPDLRNDRRSDGQGQDLLLCQRRLHAPGSDDVSVAHASFVRASAGRQPELRRQLPPEAPERAR